MDSHKVCPRCDRLLPHSSFAKNSRRRDGLQAYCRECKSDMHKKSYDPARSREKYLENRSEINKRNRDYYYRNYAQSRDRQAAWRSLNPEYNREYYQENRDYFLSRARDWSRLNRDHVNGMKRARYSADPSRVKESNHLYRARNNGAQGFFDWSFALELYGHRCAICGDSKSKLTVGHIAPLSRGGSNWQFNIRPECQSCNCSKGARMDSEVPGLCMLAAGDWPDVE